MIDTVYSRLKKIDAEGVEFLEETPCYLENLSEHKHSDGNVTMIGWLGGLKVVVNEHQVKVSEGSLCKWYLGNNYQVMSRADIQAAVEKLSDELHLPMDKAKVTRLDVANNIFTKHPVETYFNHMGELNRWSRFRQPHSLYYMNKKQMLCLYDKNREMKDKGEVIPEIYKGKNVLRIEQRYIQRLPYQLREKDVTMGMLYEEKFYIKMVQQWQEKYEAIKKTNDLKPNFKEMKTRKGLYIMGVLSMVEQMGGETAMLSQIKESQTCGELTAKQAFDIRRTIKDTCSVESAWVIKSEAITELDKKVAEAVEYCM